MGRAIPCCLLAEAEREVEKSRDVPGEERREKMIFFGRPRFGDLYLLIPTDVEETFFRRKPLFFGKTVEMSSLDRIVIHRISPFFSVYQSRFTRNGYRNDITLGQ